MSRKNYTQFGKWYGILSLGFIAFFNNPIHRATNTTLSFTLLAIQSDNHRALFGILVTSLLFILGIAVVILGILNERLWAKWLAVAIYSLSLVTILPAILMAFSNMMAIVNPINLTGIVVFLLQPLLHLVIPIFGIILMLKKSKNSEMESKI